MSASPSVHHDAADRPAATWPFWVGIAGIAIVLIPYLDQAIADWREDQRLRKTVLDFFQAVAEGRKDTTLGLLSEEYRSAVESGWHRTFDEHWRPTDGVVYQILSVRRNDAEADVRIAVVRSTFSLKPTVHLRRLPEDVWRITRIDGLVIDPRWVRWKESEEEDDQSNLTDELAEKLHAEE